LERQRCGRRSRRFQGPRGPDAARHSREPASRRPARGGNRATLSNEPARDFETSAAPARRQAGGGKTQRRNRLYELNAKPLKSVDDWLGDYRQFWRGQLRNLKRYVEANEAKE